MFDEVLPQIVRMWTETDYSFDGEFFSMPAAQRAAQAAAPSPTRRCGSPPATPAPSRPRPRWASACCASPSRNPEALKPLIEVYKTNIGDADPVGEYVNDNIMVTTQMLCLEDGQKAKRDRHQHDERLPNVHPLPVPRHLPEARRACPTWPDAHPRADAGRRSSESVERGLMCIGTPDEVERAWPSLRGDSAPTSSSSGCSRRRCRSRSPSRPWRPSAHVIPEFDKDPVHRTTAQREAQVSPQPA